MVFLIIFSYNLYLTLSFFYYYENFSLFLEYFLLSTLLIECPNYSAPLLIEYTNHAPTLLMERLNSPIDPISVLGGHADLTRYPGYASRDLILDEYSKKGKVFLEELHPFNRLYSKPVVAYDNPFTRVPDLQFYYKSTQTPILNVFDTNRLAYSPILETSNNSGKCFFTFERVDRRLKSPFDIGHTCVELERSPKLDSNGNSFFYKKTVTPERVSEFLRNP